MTEPGQRGIVKNQKLLKAAKNRKWWRVMIDHILKDHSTWMYLGKNPD